MLSPEKSALLTSFLAGLPAQAAMKLAKAVEVDRLAGGKLLPHELILGALRPMLRTSDTAPRTPTPQRLFCRPFEDLIVSDAPKQKVKGRIARPHISTVWNWVNLALLPEASAAYCAEMKALILSGRADATLERAAQFWALAGAAMRNAVATDRKAIRSALGGDLVLADAEEMALLLSAGSEVGEIQRLLPKLTPALDEQMLWKLRDIHDRLAASMPDAAAYVAVVAMNRLAHPWEALKLPQLVTHQTQDTLISATDMGLVGDLLFADIEHHGGAIRAARHPVFDADAMIEHLSHFALLSSSIVKEIDIRRDGKWGKRLLKDRAAVAETMEGFMERAPKEVLTMLPVQKSGAFGGGPKCADFSRAVDDEKAERGLRYARLVIGSGSYAAMGSFAATQKDAFEEIAQHLKGYNEDLIKEMRSLDGASSAAVERQFELAAELTAQFFSAQEEEFLRRRAKAAQGAQAAA